MGAREVQRFRGREASGSDLSALRDGTAANGGLRNGVGSAVAKYHLVFQMESYMYLIMGRLACG